MNQLVKILLIVVGTFLVGLGILGIFLPLLPTTPFLLLAAACYARGSTKFYNWLLGNKWFGSYIKNWREGKGIPLKTKILAISLLIFTIGYASIFVVRPYWGKICLVLIALGVSIHIISIPNLKEENRGRR